MIDVGIIGLDTSHAEKFAELLSDREDATIAAVWDDGRVRDDAYAERFCESYDATRYDQAAAMVDHVDAAMVLTVNWDRHRPLAERFLDAGVPTFVDKPVAGSLEDVNALADAAARTDTPAFGGSAVPYHPSVEPIRSDGGPHDLFAGGYNGSFYYGVHLVDTVRRIAGADWTRVEPAPHRAAVSVTFADGSAATLRFEGPAFDGAFALLDVGEAIRTASIPGTEAELYRMYEPFLEAFLEIVAGDRSTSPWIFDASRLLLAVQATLSNDTTVTPDSESLAAVSMDGEAFSHGYSPLY